MRLSIDRTLVNYDDLDQKERRFSQLTVDNFFQLEEGTGFVDFFPPLAAILLYFISK